MNIQTILAICVALILTCYCLTDERKNPEEPNPNAYHPLTIKEDPLTPYKNYIRYKKQRRREGHVKNEAPEIFAEIERAKRTPIDLSAPSYLPNYKMTELRKAKLTQASSRSNDFEFIERGPANVAGRTRAVLVLPGDINQQTWIAGSATGGIWKTKDGGQRWEDKTPGFPNLGTNTLAMSKSDPNIIYAGTGEHFTNDIDGTGMFKSTDQGESWEQIVSDGDYDAFKNVSRIIVDPANADILIASTRNSVFEDSLRAAIYKSIDGGATWQQLRLSTTERYDDLAFNPQNFNTLYASIQRTGVIKSTDGGKTWVRSSNGLQINGRLEISTSPLDTNYVWGLAQGDRTNTGSDLYLSKDGGSSWKIVSEASGEAIDYLGGQGWYDNALEPHPFAKDVAYVGGVNLFKVKSSPSEITDVIYDIQDSGAFTFLDFINGISIGGGILEGNVPAEEVVSIEVRFGEGKQKAHRFTVNGRGSGVPAADYEYQDLVDVPFQVWDINNDRQLMVSFRDQQEDSTWTLKSRSITSNTSSDSREYIFIHNVTYADSANSLIAIDGGHEFEQLYFMWPVLRTNGVFDPNSEEVRSFSILTEQTTILGGETTVISDAYEDFNGNNGFSNEEFANNQGNHPDQHSIQSIIIDSSLKLFRLLVSNDGGVYVTNTARDPGTLDGTFNYAGFRMNTTQFYGADKMPGEERYIGGMQDNSTWLTAEGEVATAASVYDFAFGGDGFEAVWNNRDPQKIIGSVQFNSFRRSLDGGRTWSSATGGIDAQGPFISRLANTRALPDRLFSVSSSGVLISNDFGGVWKRTPIIDSEWSFNNSMDIEVSPANFDVIWAGGALSETERIYISQDGGQSFTKSFYYQDIPMGRMSGLALHPLNDSVGYALFSFARRPKVLMTSDFGNSWTDISGFNGNNETSTRGFPDVAVYSLLVFPNNPDRIWVGSEIGIIESDDGGDSWHLLNANLPSVVVFDMRIQDDEIILATYGRGIWTVSVEGIRQEYIFPPNITGISPSPSGRTDMVIESETTFDSLRITVEDLYEGTIMGPVSPGENTFGISDLDLEDGTYEFVVTGYFEGNAYKSFPFSTSIFKPLPATDNYFNDFSIDSLLNDFIGEGFSIALVGGFQDPAIHSEHNYPDRTELTYLLKRPFIVSEQQEFRYKDVAIIELGEAGVTFGSQDFFDFVVIEGSLDGIFWKPIADGYDSSFDPDWEATYNAEQNGNSSLFVTHEVDLKNEFAVGDTIFVRFRLFADPFVNGWGWAIDDVELLKLNTTSISDTKKGPSIQVYPNPAHDFIMIESSTSTEDLQIVIRDISGKVLYNGEITGTNTSASLSLESMQSGIHIIEIFDGKERIKTEKIVVVKN